MNLIRRHEICENVNVFLVRILEIHEKLRSGSPAFYNEIIKILPLPTPLNSSDEF